MADDSREDRKDIVTQPVTTRVSDPDRLQRTLHLAPALILAALELPAEPDAQLRFVFVYGSELAVRDVPAEPDAYVVAGRHPNAGLGALGAYATSLRHALVIPWTTPRGPFVEVVPLAPTVPIATADELLSAELRKRGAAFVIGDGLLFVAALGLDVDANSATTQLAERNERDEACYYNVEDLSREAPESRVYSAVMARPHGDAAEPRSRPAPGSLLLELKRADLCVQLELTQTLLTDGILIGRSERKSSHAALSLALSSDRMSRLHLLLRQEGDAIVFYELGSTNGCSVAGELVRRVALRPTGASPHEYGAFELMLGTEVSVRLVRADAER